VQNLKENTEIADKSVISRVNAKILQITMAVTAVTTVTTVTQLHQIIVFIVKKTGNIKKNCFKLNRIDT
jgi:hypothetical protein